MPRSPRDLARAFLLLAVALPLVVPRGARAQPAETWPDLSVPLGAPPEPAPNDAALIVGIERYVAVTPIAGAVRNAQDWYLHLNKARGVPAENIRILRDNEGTVEKMRRFAAEAARKVGPGGTLWFVFIGHGAPSRDGRTGVLVGYDAQQDADSLYARSLPQTELAEIFNGGRQTRSVLVVDACFSGRAANGAALVEGLQPLIVTSAASPTERTVSFVAAAADQFAGPLPGASRPAFSYLMLGGLRGWADENGDGEVSYAELVGYTRSALATTVTDRSQTPELVATDPKAPLAKARERGPDLGRLVLHLSKPAPAVGMAAPAPAPPTLALALASRPAEPDAAARQRFVPRPLPPASGGSRSTLEVAGYVGVGLGLATAGVGGFLLKQRLGERNEAQAKLDALYAVSQPRSGGRCDPTVGAEDQCKGEIAESEKKADRATSAANRSLVILGAGGALAGLGVLLLLAAPDAHEASVQTTVQTSAWVDQGGAGVSVGKRF